MSTTIEKLREHALWIAARPRGELPTCSDHDDECIDVRCKVTCWLYDPQRGMCPYLRDGEQGRAPS